MAIIGIELNTDNREFTVNMDGQPMTNFKSVFVDAFVNSDGTRDVSLSITQEGALVVASLWLLSVSMRTLPIGTAYTVWAGIGTVGTVILGIVLLGESASPMRLLSIALIIVGILGLKLAH